MEINKNNYEAVRLGKLKDNIELTEPIIRDADMMCFNLNAIRYSECPGVDSPTPSGFFTEEACQIARYAGICEKISSVGFYGYQSEPSSVNRLQIGAGFLTNVSYNDHQASLNFKNRLDLLSQVFVSTDTTSKLGVSFTGSE